jgi:hypothetical protein
MTMTTSPLLPLHPAGGYNEVRATSTSVTYLRDGITHRTDGPAVISIHGDEHWYCDGLRHRDGGPAVTSRNGMIQHWVDGVRAA